MSPSAPPRPADPAFRARRHAAILATTVLAAAALAQPSAGLADAPSRRTALVMPPAPEPPARPAFPGHHRPDLTPAASPRAEVARLCEAPMSRTLPACWCAGDPIHASCGVEAPTAATSSAAIVPPPATQALLRRYGR